MLRRVLLSVTIAFAAFFSLGVMLGDTWPAPKPKESIIWFSFLDNDVTIDVCHKYALYGGDTSNCTNANVKWYTSRSWSGISVHLVVGAFDATGDEGCDVHITFGGVSQGYFQVGKTGLRSTGNYETMNLPNAISAGSYISVYPTTPADTSVCAVQPCVCTGASLGWLIVISGVPSE